MKYNGIRIDSKFNWKTHIDDIALKVIRANAMLYKVRDFLILKFIMPYLSHLYGDRMYIESIVFSYFKRKHQRLMTAKQKLFI